MMTENNNFSHSKVRDSPEKGKSHVSGHRDRAERDHAGNKPSSSHPSSHSHNQKGMNHVHHSSTTNGVSSSVMSPLLLEVYKIFSLIS